MTDDALDIGVMVKDPAWPEGLDTLAERAVGAVLAKLEPVFAGPGELAIVLTSDAEQQALNKAWRRKDQPTNVLSFAHLDPGAPLSGLIGDIVLARETIIAEADAGGTSLADHFAHLVVHGFLHILGYDHLNAADALVMEGLETQILADLDIANPYAGDAA